MIMIINHHKQNRVLPLWGLNSNEYFNLNAVSKTIFVFLQNDVNMGLMIVSFVVLFHIGVSKESVQLVTLYI